MKKPRKRNFKRSFGYSVRRKPFRLEALFVFCFLLCGVWLAGDKLRFQPSVVKADNNYFALAVGTPFTQDWSDAGLITVNDSWSGVPSINGYRGDDATAGAGVNPQTILTDLSAVIDVNANQTNPNTFSTGGVTEFAITNPTVALTGSGTADFPHIDIRLNTSGCAAPNNAVIRYNLRDLDGSTDDAAQPVSLQYRVGAAGNYTDIPEAFAADATTGPDLATLVTPVGVLLPAAALGQPQVHLRVMTSNAAGNDEWVGIDDIDIQCSASTAVKLGEAAAYSDGNGALIKWRTGWETRNLGYNIYRLNGEERQLVNPSLLAGSALTFGSKATLNAGNGYAWFDPQGNGESAYLIEEIDTNGTRAEYGPVRVASVKDLAEAGGGQPARMLQDINAAPSSNADILRQVLPDTLANLAARRIAPETDAWRLQRTIAGGAAVKIGVKHHGWYRVTQSQLAAAGLNADANAANLRLYADGVETPIAVNATSGNTLGANGYVEFFGLGADTAATDTRTYWLVEGNSPGLRVGPPARIAAGPGAGEASAVNAKTRTLARIAPPGNRANFTYTVERHDRKIYFPSVLNGAEDNFYSTAFATSPATQTLQIQNLDANAAGREAVEVALQGLTAGAHRARVRLNNQDLGVAELSGTEKAVRRFTVPRTALLEGENTLALNTENGPNDAVAVDYARVTYAHRYAADNNQLLFTPGASGNLNIGGFTGAGIRVFDLTEPERIFELAARVAPEASGYSVSLNGDLRGRALFAVEAGRYLAPAFVNANEPSQWTARQRAADFIILTPRAFRDAVAPLAAARAGQGLNTQVINLEDVYDEWNGGAADVESLRGFLAWTQENWLTAPRYVLLAGSASYDPRNYLGYGAYDLAPTVFFDALDFETASDESLVDFNGDGVGEISVGRLPARNVAEMRLLANRSAGFTPVENGRVVLVADRPDGYDFSGMNEATRAVLPESVPVSLINRFGQSDEATRNQIINALNQGPAVLQYRGHGSPQVWTGAPLFSVDYIPGLTNGSRLPLVSMISCLNGYFVNPNYDSLAEAVIKAPNGGGIAAWASSGLSVAPTQALMEREFYRLTYQSASAPRLGDAIRQAKAATQDSHVRRTFILFGDPTLRIR